jgi:signal transduction histidine kinase
MRIIRENRKIFQIAAIAVLIVTGFSVSSYFFFERWEKKLVLERKEICSRYAGLIATEINQNDSIIQVIRTLTKNEPISVRTSNLVDKEIAAYFEAHLIAQEGLEGGLFLKGLNDFIGYAYPTSPPPVPVYGPPPRSYNIIKSQALETIAEGISLTNLHAFDPAVFPLSTSPVFLDGEISGAVWVRIHIERELPVTKLKRVVNLLTVISLTGFLITAMISLFLRNGIKNIRRELINAKTHPGFRLKRRGGWFGFIPASINEMLDIIEHEYARRQDLENKLRQEEKLASLGKMIAGVAHEVKTPLSIIKMRVQMWQRELRKNPEMGEILSTESIELVLNEIDRLSGLVKRLVVFSRPIGKNLTRVDINVIIDEVISLVGAEHGTKEIRISKELMDQPPFILADPNSLKQVLLNIITNSIESIAVSGDIHVKTKCSKDGHAVLVELADTGTGIPDEIMNSVFDPFFTTKDQGAGLGLSISHEIVTAHDGTIAFSRSDKYGTICIISLPLIKKSKSS